MPIRRLTLNQALIFAVIAALLPIAAFSIAQGFWSRDFSRQLIAERLVTSALATAATQNEPISAAQRILAAFAQDQDVRGWTDQCNATLARGLSDQLINFGSLDAQGFVQCSALPFQKPINNANEAWWKRGVENRRFTLSTPTIGKITKRRLIVAMQPLYDRGGSFAGALTAGIDASWIEKALAERKLSRDAIVAITDASGKVLLAGSDRTLSGVDLRASYGTASTLTAPDGSKWMYASAPLYGRDLYVVYAEPQGALLSPLRDQLQVNLMIPILALLFSCVAVWWAVNRFVVRWLKSLGGLTRQFALGHYDGEPAKFDSAPGEIAELSGDLHSMARAIEDRDTDLRAANVATRAMAREVNHRVKNNLQMIMSLISLQAARITDEESKRAFDQTRLRMTAVSLIHRVLYEHDEGGERGLIDMDRLMTEIGGQLRNNFSNDRIALACRSTIGVISVDQAVPLTLFLVEGVTNAYRHAFPDDRSGSIDIALSAENENARLSMVDDGIGYDSAAAIDAMGLELMRAFAEQLLGELAIESNAQDGVNIVLTFRVRRETQIA